MFWSKPCIFLGYSSTHKGCKCLDPQSQRIYISRDVTFNEASFPFTKPKPTLLNPPEIPASSKTHTSVPLFQPSILGPGLGSDPSPISSYESSCPSFNPNSESPLLSPLISTSPSLSSQSHSLISTSLFRPLLILHPPCSPMIIRSHTNTFRSQKLTDGTIPYPSR